MNKKLQRILSSALAVMFVGQVMIYETAVHRKLNQQNIWGMKK